MTLGWLSGPEPEPSQGLRGEEDESGPRQDREEDPGGGKGIGDEAARQRTEKREGTEADVIRNTAHAEKRNTLRKRKGPSAVLAPAQAVRGGSRRLSHACHTCGREGGRPHGPSKSRAHIKDIRFSFIRLLSKCIQFKVEK